MKTRFFIVPYPKSKYMCFVSCLSWNKLVCRNVTFSSPRRWLRSHCSPCRLSSWLCLFFKCRLAWSESNSHRRHVKEVNNQQPIWKVKEFTMLYNRMCFSYYKLNYIELTPRGKLYLPESFLKITKNHIYDHRRGDSLITYEGKSFLKYMLLLFYKPTVWEQ